jgi:hypothetical protein
VRSAAEVDEVRRLSRQGEPAAAIARRLGIPRTTVRGWLNPTARTPRPPRVADLSTLPPTAYAYLLGLYLGEGHVASTGRSYRLTIKLDAAYPGIVDAAAAAVAAVMPGSRGRRAPASDTTLRGGIDPLDPVAPAAPAARPRPQAHAPHPADAVAARAHVRRATRPLVRGLIHSDGSRYVAVVRRRGRAYSYERYSFANRSDDIKAIFCAHLDLLGIRWTRPNEKDIAVARKADVALLDAFIGPKR